jgi:non-heme Fe2+,alpha-ketoglutarate-dependent halogenase
MVTMAETAVAHRPPPAAIPNTPPGLSAEQIEFFHEHGYVGPLTLCPPEEMAEMREWIDSEDFLNHPSPIYGLGPSGPRGARVLRDWHLVYRRMHWLCTHPVAAAAMGSILGPDLLLWRSQFIYKEANGWPVAWHQDLGFPGPRLIPALKPVKNVSAWIAIDRAGLDNGCVWFVPGSHKNKIERRMTKAEGNEPGLMGRHYTIEYVIDTSIAVPMVVEPGQFFLFSESTLHGSPPNPSDKRRLGLALRATTPEVFVYENQDVDGQGFNLDKWACVMMSGEDRYGRNRIVEPQFID